MTENTEEAVAWTGLRYVRADPTDEQRAAICETDLVKQGDTVLVWINEGDLYMPDARVAVAEAENAKLRALSEKAIRLMNKYAREAGEATGKLETSELAGIVDDWKARALKAEAALEEALRRVEKLEAALEKIAGLATDEVCLSDSDWLQGRDEGLFDAAQIARQALTGEGQ